MTFAVVAAKVYRCDLYSRTSLDGITRAVSSGSIRFIRLSINMNRRFSGVAGGAPRSLTNGTHVACLSAGVIFLSK